MRGPKAAKPSPSAGKPVPAKVPAGQPVAPKQPAGPPPGAAGPKPAGPAGPLGKLGVKVPPTRLPTPQVAQPKPKEKVQPISSVEAARRGATNAKNEEIKETVKLRKMEALLRQLLDEWTSLAQEKKEEAISLIATKFVERVPAEFLATMAEQFAEAAAGYDGEKQTSRPSNDEANYYPEEQTEANYQEEQAEENPYGKLLQVKAQEPEVEEPAVEEAYGYEGDQGEASGGFAQHEAMRQLLVDACDTPPASWNEAWKLIGVHPAEHSEALGALLEAGAEIASDGGLELAPRIVAELARTKTVEMKDVDEALQALAQRLEDLVQVTDNAWHLYSHMLLNLFPKSTSTEWGFVRPGWTWITWWQMTERVLTAADAFRAFDILVFVLQLMQDKSGSVIRLQQVWKESGRTQRVKKALGTWGEMDNAGIMETLAAYGVEV